MRSGTQPPVDLYAVGLYLADIAKPMETQQQLYGQDQWRIQDFWIGRQFGKGGGAPGQMVEPSVGGNKNNRLSLSKIGGAPPGSAPV